MTAQPSHHCFFCLEFSYQSWISDLEEKQRKKASKYAKKRQLKKEVQSTVETTPAEPDEGEIWGMA